MLRLLPAVSFFALLPISVEAQGDRPTEIERGWLESFLMTREERRASIEAMSRGDRAAFRRLFWMRRDPQPETPENEILDHYLGRVRLAERNFGQDGGYGGGGDRARVFVLLGMPVQTLSEPATDTTPERLLWVFPADPEQGVESIVEAHYLRDEDGGLWLENRSRVDEQLEEMRRRLIARPEIGFERDEEGRLVVPNLPAGGSKRARQVLERLTREGPGDGGFGLRVTPAYFRRNDEATYVALLYETAAGHLASAPDGQAAVSVFAKAVAGEEAREAPGSGNFRWETAHTAIHAADGSARFEASLILPPGRHRVLAGVVDEQSDAWGAAPIEIEAPAFRDSEPGFSTVVLYDETTTTEFGASEFTSNALPGRAFQFGRTHFRARSNAVFRQGETLGAFYFFYPGEREDDGELPQILAEYTLSRDGRDTGFILPEAIPTSTRQAAANAEIALDGFAPGNYELGIRIHYRGAIYETARSFTLVR